MKVEVEADDLRMLLRSSMRYAMGRRSYIVSWIIDTIILHLDIFTTEQRLNMVRDIEESVMFSDECDKGEWIALAHKLREI